MDTKEILEQVSKTIETSMPEVIESVVEKKLSEERLKTVADLDDVKAELKKLSFQAKQADAGLSKKNKEAFIVSVMKSVVNNWVSTEKGFRDVVAKEYTAMNTDDAWEGAEFVFDQFEADILSVFDQFDIVRDVRIYNINQWDNLSLVRWDNTIQTYFTAQWAPRTPSNYETSRIKIDVAKLTTLTKLTEEFFDDTMTIPDVYQFLVQCFAESQAKFLETEILTWTWDIKGIFNDSDIEVVNVDKVDDISDDTIIEVITKVAKKFKTGKFYFSKYMWGRLMQIRTLDGSPLYPELRSANPNILGYPVWLSSVWFIQDKSDDETDWAVAMMFGDLSYYALVRRKGLTIERGLDWEDFSNDLISVKSTTRYGGNCTFPEALTVVKIWNSPA